MVFDVTDSAETRLEEVNIEEIERLHFMDDDGTQERADRFAIWSDGASLKMKVYPLPTATRTLKVRVVNPQAELLSSALDSTTLLVPARPVWTKALLKANEERGAELSRPGGPSAEDTRDALATAISREQTESDYTGRAV
jgi:hypothetical protein